MGNWMTVNIKGICGIEDLDALRKALEHGKDYENFHCLVGGGICGLPNWASKEINAVGNLAERDYSVQDVAEQLEKLHKIAPSLLVDVHCGGANESKICQKTVRLLPEGKVEIVGALQPEIPELDKDVMAKNMMKQMRGL